MSKSIKIDDATYKLVTKFAEQEDRQLSNALSRLVKLGLEKFASSASQAPSTPVAQVASVPFTNNWERPADRGHTVTIPSVDTSQPRESVTPHKRWVPTTPEELEAELEKVRRGEREA